MSHYRQVLTDARLLFNEGRWSAWPDRFIKLRVFPGELLLRASRPSGTGTKIIYSVPEANGFFVFILLG